MPKVPDNEMEHFFRESANNDYDIAFNPDAWKKMEQKLDRRDRKVFWLRLGTLLSFLLFVSVSLFLILGPFSSQNEVIKADQSTKKQEQSEPNTTKNTNKHTTDHEKNDHSTDKKATQQKFKDDETDKNANATTSRNSKSANLGSTDNTSKPLANGQSKDGNGAHTHATGKSKAIGGGKGTHQKGQDLKGDLPIAIGKDEEGKEKSAVYADKRKTDERHAVDSTQYVTKVENVLLATQFHLNAVPAQVITCLDCKDSLGTIPSFPKDTTGMPDPIKRIEKGWFVNFSISPDLSGVGPFIGTDGVRTGLKSGILLEYQPMARLSIYGGSYFSKKRYIANPEEYHPPSGFWTNGNTPETIDGTCNVLEIPVGLRYHFIKKERSSVFAGAGMSSYLLLREEYQYNYEMDNPNWVQKWVGTNKSKHWFGVSQFSLGFEKQLGKQSYFQVEPYIQLPLSDIGFGQVKLYSYGSYFTLKYRLK